MTPEEHKLIVWMFAKQSQQLKVLLNILKREGFLTGDDLEAFEFITRVDAEGSAAITLEVATRYAEAAGMLGLELHKPGHTPPRDIE